MIDHPTFGRLRFRDWFPEAHSRSPSNTVPNCVIGCAVAEGYESTYFARKPAGAGLIGELCLDFGADCPETAGNSLLGFLGLPLLRGMPERSIEAVLGGPHGRVIWSDGHAFRRHVVGQGDRYQLYLQCHPVTGLQHVTVCRQDLAVMTMVSVQRLFVDSVTACCTSYGLLREIDDGWHLFEAETFPDLRSVNLVLEHGEGIRGLGGMRWKPFSIEAAEHAEMKRCLDQEKPSP